MSASRIHIDVGYITELELRCASISLELHQLRYAPGRLDRSPPVAQAMDRFQGRWDTGRGEICDGLDALTDAFRTIRRSFEATDAQLAGSLEGGEG